MILARSFRPLACATLTTAFFFLSRAAAADEPTMTPEVTDCAMERHVGVSDIEAAAVEDVVCSQVRSSPAHAGGRHRLRITKIGRKLVLTLTTERGRFVDEKQIALTSLDEVNVAAPRLLDATAEQKTVDETVDVTNVVGDETRQPKKRPSSVHAYLGVIGAAAQNLGTGGGVDFGISAGAEDWSFAGDLRIAGAAFDKPAAFAGELFTLGSMDLHAENDDFSFVSLSAGARRHFSKSDLSPFVGGGIAIEYLSAGTSAVASAAYSPTSKDAPSGKMGVAGYVEVGLDVLRTRTVGGAITLRGDLPAFTTEQVGPSPSDPTKTVRKTEYTPVIGAGIALRF